MSDLKLATTNYVDSHQSGGLKGEYTYENYHSLFEVGPDNTGLKLSGGTSVLTIDNYGSESELNGNTLKLSTSEVYLGAESNITIAAKFEQYQNYEPTATIALSNPLDISNSRIHFEFKNGDDTVWGINKNYGSLYVNGPVKFNGTIYDKNNKEITGGSGYVPLGSSRNKYGALPIGANSTASGDYSTASGYNSTASNDYSTASGSNSLAYGDYSTASGNYSTASGSSTASGYSSTASGDCSTASGSNSTASGNYSTASGNQSTASGYGSTASGNNSTASGSNSTASGNYSTASGNLAQTFGAWGKNANDCCTVIAAIKGVGTDCGADIDYVTQLYLIPKGSPLAVQYENGEACLGYVTVDSNWNKIASGTKKLSELLNNNVNTFEPKLTREP